MAKDMGQTSVLTDSNAGAAMPHKCLGLQDLPVEILGCIFRVLDPIGLISTSQTCRTFRSVIQPTRIHLVEQLLQAECLEKYGGKHLYFRARDNELDPCWNTDIEQWDSMRWACTTCMRLLPHLHFNNHSILRLALRKPLPGSPATSLLTSWEPYGDRGRKHRNKQGQERWKTELQTIRRRYTIAVTRSWGSSKQAEDPIERLTRFRAAGMKKFDDISFEEFKLLTAEQETELFDCEARSIELERCGFKRRLRTCNECRFQRGDLRSGAMSLDDRKRGGWRYPGVNAGTDLVPIIHSRPVLCVGLVERWFPNVWSELENSMRPTASPPIFRIYRDEATSAPWVTYMARCPTCKRWQELRALRCGGNYQHWFPDPLRAQGNWDSQLLTAEFINSLVCNSCYAETHGREALGQVLLQWWNKAVDLDLLVMNMQLSWWNNVENRKSEYKKAGCWEEVAKHVLQGLPSSSKTEWKVANVALIRERRDRYLEIHERMVVQGTQPHSHASHWTMRRLHKFDDSFAYLVWLWRCKEELSKNTEPLIRWALGEETSSVV